MLTLEPMTEAEFENYLEPAIADYAAGHVADGQWTPAEALEKARQEFQGLLPQGVHTPDQYLFTLVNDAQQKVGMLWFAKREGPGPGSAWVYDVRIDDAFRRHGYGSAAFTEMENKVRALGGNKIALHVFGNNHGAREMYEKLGYQTTNVLMAKTLLP
jgi:ribosomal protein S18 acetylase RimI-like enzyme